MYARFYYIRLDHSLTWLALTSVVPIVMFSENIFSRSPAFKKGKQSHLFILVRACEKKHKAADLMFHDS